jgi:uncharacterized protein Yka (UPF0111/DUF47 family)
MSDDVEREAAENLTIDEAETSQAVASLSEIARELRKLADQAADLSKQLVFQPTFH